MKALVLVLALPLCWGCFSAYGTMQHNREYDRAVEIRALDDGQGGVVGAAMLVSLNKIVAAGRGYASHVADEPLQATVEGALDLGAIIGTGLIIKEARDDGETKQDQPTYDVHDNKNVIIADDGATVEQENDSHNAAE